ncbi:V-type proton ATPase subunit G [Thelohanellus kitauei]|uniref:V-type proton ATPase subunit G n=1 Tax=Thelohanellus kitauei TaxID=669202 RepID=A0A0C2JIG8_THEKT|nr:V-type proton ATPase subunit G [Thelohanellus kitauei]
MSNKMGVIQPLLQGEKRANELVAAARERRSQRLKEAKDDALSEIEAIRDECEANYKQKLRSQEEIENLKAYVRKQTEEKIEEMRESVRVNKSEAIQEILGCVKNINLSLNINYERGG